MGMLMCPSLPSLTTPWGLLQSGDRLWVFGTWKLLAGWLQALP